MTEPTLRDRLLSAPGKPVGTHPLNGVTVHLRRLTLGERSRLVALADQKDRNPVERQAEMCRLLVANPDNSRVFGDTPEEAAAALEVIYGDDADALIDAGLAANGIGPKAVDRGKANSPPTRNSGSSGGSASPPAAAAAPPPSSPGT